MGGGGDPPAPLAATLGLAPEPIPVSGVVLREHGNVGSATILLILDWLVVGLRLLPRIQE